MKSKEDMNGINVYQDWCFYKTTMTETTRSTEAKAEENVK